MKSKHYFFLHSFISHLQLRFGLVITYLTYPLLWRFMHCMDLAYAAADLIVSRAGAMTCYEILATGKPSILVVKFCFTRLFYSFRFLFKNECNNSSAALCRTIILCKSIYTCPFKLDLQLITKENDDIFAEWLFADTFAIFLWGESIQKRVLDGRLSWCDCYNWGWARLEYTRHCNWKDFKYVTFIFKTCLENFLVWKSFHNFSSIFNKKTTNQEIRSFFMGNQKDKDAFTLVI